MMWSWYEREDAVDGWVVPSCAWRGSEDCLGRRTDCPWEVGVRTDLERAAVDSFVSRELRFQELFAPIAEQLKVVQHVFYPKKSSLRVAVAE